MVSKNYFFKHLENFKEFYNGRIINIINDENTIFVSIPLIRAFYSPQMNYQIMKKVFKINFLNDLTSRIYEKRLFTSSYLYSLIIHSLRTNRTFIMRYLLDFLFNKNKVKTFKRLYHERI